MYERHAIERSDLRITWARPDLREEEREFTHPAKLGFYARHGITWEKIGLSFDSGRLTPYPRSEYLSGIPVAGSHSSYDDYLAFVARARRGYRSNYTQMERALQMNGHLVLPAPIVLHAGGEGLLFSGYRRLCLAWNYGILPHVWLVAPV